MCSRKGLFANHVTDSKSLLLPDTGVLSPFRGFISEWGLPYSVKDGFVEADSRVLFALLSQL